MTYNTGNPIGSTDARDRSDNSENLDLAVNSLSQTFVDRLGVTRDTLEGIYQKSAYYRAGTFDAGYTLTNNRQTLAYGNVEYSWSGAFPKVVSAGSTPETSGGVGAGAWVDRTSDSIRSELQQEYGSTLVGSCRSIASLRTIEPTANKQTIKLLSYYDDWAALLSRPTGGGNFVYDSSDSTSEDDGVLTIVTAGGKRWKRIVVDGDVDAYMAGARIDGVTNDLPVLVKALSSTAYNYDLLIPYGKDKAACAISDTLELPDGASVVCSGEIKLTAISWSGTAVSVFGKQDVRWTGGIINANDLEGQNGFSVGWYNDLAPKNVHVRDLHIKNCVWNSTTFGGKAVALHQGCTDVSFDNIVSDDCSIGCSVEGLYDATNPNRVSHGIHLSNFTVRGCNRTAIWMYQGSATSLQDPNSYSAVLDNFVIENCTPMAGMGIISCDRANAVKLTATINNVGNSESVQLIRGSMTNCNFDVSAVVTNCSGAIDFTPHTGGGGYVSLNNKVDILVNTLGSSSGYLVAYSATYPLTASILKIQYLNFVGSGLFNNIGSSITFDLLRLSDGYRVAGNSVDGSIPAVVAAYHTYLMGNVATEGLLFTHSTANAVGIIKAAVSTEQLRFDSGAGNTMLQTMEPASGQAALLIRNNNGTARLSQVTLGATDSGGTGFKLLRVPN